jgi:hypothetical protein
MTITHPVPNTPLPTLDRLGASVPADIDAKAIAKQWFSDFSTALKTSNTQNLSTLFVSNAFWRDMLALTWEFRTFSGLPSISQFLTDRLSTMHPIAFTLRDDAYLGLQKPFPDVAWVQMMFDFETDTGIALGIARLVPTSDGSWKAHTVFTNLEDLKGFPEKKGPLRNHQPNHGKWEEDRRREREFEDREPAVVIIGGGQGGLDLAARLKCLDVPALVVEKNPRIGDNWRNRYEALCLHDPVCEYLIFAPYNTSSLAVAIRVRSHAIPSVRSPPLHYCLYSPRANHSFPPTWPTYTPALKLADWLESYASTLELNVWTSSTVTSATPDVSGSKWTVSIKRPDGERVFKQVRHVVFATGFGGGSEGIKLPKYTGMVSMMPLRFIFQKLLCWHPGHVQRPTAPFPSAQEGIGSQGKESGCCRSVYFGCVYLHSVQNVIQIGASHTAHDIAVDYYENGIGAFSSSSP